MAENIEGFYAVYFSGLHDAGFAMFIFSGGHIVGSDPMGVKFDGRYVPSEEGGYAALVAVDVPPNGTTVQGVTSGPTGLKYNVELSIPNKFWEKDFLTISTPLGPVNAKFNRVRGLDV